MTISAHDDHVTADLERVLSKDVFDAPFATRNLFDNDFDAMPGEECRDVSTRLSTILKIRAIGIDDHHMHCIGFNQHMQRLLGGACCFGSRVPSEKDILRPQA